MKTNLDLLNESEKDLEWLQQNFLDIQEKFANKIIAIKNKKIIANSENISKLLEEVQSQGIDPSEVLIEAISPKNEITLYN